MVILHSKEKLKKISGIFKYFASVSIFVLLVFVLNKIALFGYGLVFNEKRLQLSILRAFYRTILIFKVVLHLVYRGIYLFPNGYFNKYKINSHPWPWEENREKAKSTIKYMITVSFLNLAAIGLFLLVIVVPILQAKSSIDENPSFLRVLMEISVMIFCDDFLFYWVHRILHWPVFYNRIHKWHHNYPSVIHASTIFCHPVEFFFGDFIPGYSGLIVLGKHTHYITFLTWVMLRLIEGNEIHCGFDFPWSPFNGFPLSISNTYHNYHHFKNKGNYATLLMIWDTIFKTNKEYYVDLEKKMGQIEVNQ